MGYKKTEVGVIPEDWEVREVAEFSKIVTGPFGTLLKASEYSQGDGVPQISVGEIGDGCFRVNEHTSRIPPHVVKRLPQYLLRAGDIVFGRKGAVDRSAMVTESEAGWFLGSDGINVRPAQGHSPYLAAQFSSKPVKTWLLNNAIGTTMPSLNQSVLGRIRVPFAPQAEQSAIATALSDVDALLAAQDTLIAKKRAIKQGAMQELLTGKRRLPGFGGELEVKRLGELAHIRNQKVSTSQVDPETLCVELENVGQGSGRLDSRSNAGSAISTKYTFQVGDVLFGRLRSYLRKYWIATESGLCTTEIWPLATDERLVPSYLFALVQTDSFIDAASVAFGTHMPRADWDVIRNFEISLPSTEEQIAISKVMDDMDAEVFAMEAAREKIAELKQGMMQALLTGRIRLV